MTKKIHLLYRSMLFSLEYRGSPPHSGVGAEAARILRNARGLSGISVRRKGLASYYFTVKTSLMAMVSAVSSWPRPGPSGTGMTPLTG